MRIGTTPFLNARPLVWGLEKAHEIVPLAPSRMASALLAGRVDVAIVPVVEMFRDRRLAILPAAGIGCRGAVKSVRLLTRGGFGRSVTLYGDSNSSTSILLSQLVLRRMFGVRRVKVRRVEAGRFAPSRLGEGEALLQIGDIALRPAPRGFRVHDLGALWGVLTGLPFVFAPWMVRRGRNPRGATALLAKAARRGMSEARAVATAHLPPGCSVAEAVRYLRENLSFRIGKDERRSIRLFEKMLRKEGLL